MAPRRLMVVCLETEPRKTQDGIEVVPLNRFLDMLWGGEIAGNK